MEKKTIYKKVCFWIFVVFIIICGVMIFGSDNSTTTTADIDKEQSTKTYSIGETWTVENQWKLTINSISVTSKRNEFSDKTPKQVVYVTYTYENLGYEDSNGIMEGLYFDLEPNGDAIIVDGEGEIAYSYPNDITTQPQETPVGAKCVNAQSCIGLNNESKTITMNISKYDGNGKQQKATYILNID